jgi:TRAP transporter 4TM/12TM fusion protein
MSDDAEESLTGLMAVLFAVGGRRMPDGLLGVLIKALAVGIALWVVYVTTFTFIDPLLQAAVFLCFMLALLFLVVGATPQVKRQRPPLFDVALSLTSIACGVYFIINADILITRISLLDPLTEGDLVFGTLFCVLSIEATRRSVGLGLCAIVIVMLAYNLWGDHLSGLLAHGAISYRHFLDQTVFTTNGLLGAPVRVAATYAFLFVTFGTILEQAGGGEFFFNLAAAISGRSVGGPAKVAVFSSALYGMISGSPTADVLTTGSITIPMMRRLGYPRALAGAIEVAASTSGGIIPPVMASAAFIMVEITGIPYLTIAEAAILPAALYLLGLFIQVHLLSQKLNLAPMEADKIPKLRQTLGDGGLFVMPIAALVIVLFLGYSVTLVAVIGIASVIVVATLRRATRMGPRKLMDSLATATLRMVPVTAACAAAGLVVGGISMTGLSGKFSYIVFLFGGNSELMTLILTAAICILLGMGMPTPSAYIMAAVLTAPTLAHIGLSTLTAHMFLLYFSVMSAMTPPVAVAAFAASSLAECNPLSIAARSVTLALPAFFVPFIFAFAPSLIGQGPWGAIALTAVTGALGVGAISVSVAGFLRGPLAWYLRLLMLSGGMLLLFPGIKTDAIGAVICAGVVAVVWIRNQNLVSRTAG